MFILPPACAHGSTCTHVVACAHVIALFARKHICADTSALCTAYTCEPVYMPCVSVCSYVPVYVCICTCVYLYMCICMCVGWCWNVSLPCVYVHVLCAHKYVLICIPVHVYMCLRMCPLFTLCIWVFRHVPCEYMCAHMQFFQLLSAAEKGSSWERCSWCHDAHRKTSTRMPPAPLSCPTLSWLVGVCVPQWGPPKQEAANFQEPKTRSPGLSHTAGSSGFYSWR